MSVFALFEPTSPGSSGLAIRPLHLLNEIGAALILGAFCLLTSGCGDRAEIEVAATYEAYREAIEFGDVQVVSALVVAENRADFDGPHAAKILEVLKEMAPPSPTVTGVTMGSSRATLAVEGVVDGNRLAGTVSLRWQEGLWRIEDESWTMDLGQFESKTDLAALLEDRPDRPPRKAQVYPAHDGEVTRVAYSPDGLQIVSISYEDYTIRLRDTETGAELFAHEFSHRPHDMVVSPSGDRVYVVEVGGDLRSYPLTYGEIGPGQLFKGICGKNPQIAISADGSRIVSTGFDKPMRLWDTETFKMIQIFEGTEKMRGVDFAGEGLTFAAGSISDFFTVCDIEEKGLFGGTKAKNYKVPKVSEQSDLWAIAFDASGTFVVTGHMDSSITLWDVGRGKQVANFFIQNASTMDATFGSDGTVFATAQNDGSVYLFTSGSGRQLARLIAHEGAAKTVAFHPKDGTTLATGGKDGMIVVWKAPTDSFAG